MNEATNTDLENEEKAVKERLASIKRVILVLSGKGGVGKSTIAANLAVSLAREGLNVGLLDIDFHGPSIPGILGLSAEKVQSNNGHMAPVEFTPNLKVMSIGFMLRDQDDAVIWRGPMKFGIIKQFLGDVEWGELDCLVIDSPPGTGDEPLSVAQLVQEKAEGIIVTTPQKVSVDDVRKSVTFCTSVKLPITGIIENMSGFVCPGCGEKYDIFSSGGGQALAEDMKIPYLGSIPIDPGVVISGDTGSPFATGQESSPMSEAFELIFKKIV